MNRSYKVCDDVIESTGGHGAGNRGTVMWHIMVGAKTSREKQIE